LVAIFLIFILLSVSFSGCIHEEQESELKDLPPKVHLDQPSKLPEWEDGEYHDYYETGDTLNEFQIKYPDLINVFSIGNSVLGKELWCVRITNEKNNDEKFTCLIDGCIHGHEWEAGEACLYLAEYLLVNFNNNETITTILNTTEVYLVPLVNPDGRQIEKLHYQGNDNGVDLNRNFDVFFGRLRGRCLRLGKLFGRIKIPVIKIPPNNPPKWWRNCGRYAFSEPESQALKDLMISLNRRDFSFYVNCHTATHEVVTPWVVFKPPFEMKQKEKDVFNYVLKWVEDNTEYEAYREGPGNVGGLAMDWCFQEFRIPSFIFEILSLDYESFRTGEIRHEHLVHWMKTTIPVFMYLLVNIDNLHQWKTPDIQPPLPEGVPPPPL